MALPPPQDPVPVDQLAQMDYDKGAFFFGVVPLAVIGVLAVAGLILYFFRKGKNWNEIGAEMRTPEEPGSGTVVSDEEPFSAAREELPDERK